MNDKLEFLKKAIAIPSVSGQEQDVAEYLLTEMRSFCDEAFIDESGSAIGKLGHGDLNIVFLGHIDTVAGDIPVRVEEGELWGRGSVDAKGSFCTAVAAAAQLSETFKDKVSLTLIGATEEEAASSKGARYAASTYEKPDLVIIGEPSNWDAMTLGYKGRLVSKWTLSKANFHSAGQGSTAAEDMVSIWNQLKSHAEAYNQDKKGIFDALQIALQEIRSKTDGLEQTANAVIGYRLPPELKPETLERLINDFSFEFEDATVSVIVTGQEIAYRSEKDTVLTRAFRTAIRQSGGKPRFKVKTGTSDMNVVAPIWNVPMLAYGPGDSNLDHTPEERLSLAEYQKAVTVLATALELLAS